MVSNELVCSITYKLACAYSQDWNQSGHPNSLVSLNFPPWRNIEPLATHREPIKDWSGCADVQANLSLQWTHMPTCTFCNFHAGGSMCLWSWPTSIMHAASCSLHMKSVNPLTFEKRIKPAASIFQTKLRCWKWLFACWVIMQVFCHLLIFFKLTFFKKKKIRNTTRVFQIKPDLLLGLV